MSESKQDEQYLENSAIASRQRMTEADWLKETINDGYLLDDLDSFEFTQEIIDIFKHTHHDAAECGYRLTKFIRDNAERVNKERMDEFETELEEM